MNYSGRQATREGDAWVRGSGNMIMTAQYDNTACTETQNA
jgi:hypothetical protein